MPPKLISPTWATPLGFFIQCLHYMSKRNFNLVSSTQTQDLHPQLYFLPQKLTILSFQQLRPNALKSSLTPSFLSHFISNQWANYVGSTFKMQPESNQFSPPSQLSPYSKPAPSPAQKCTMQWPPDLSTSTFSIPPLTMFPSHSGWWFF